MRKFKFLIIVVLLGVGCKKTTQSKHDIIRQTVHESLKTEKYRPKFHFTPKANWMNDPNGLVYYTENYHLFYQYYPDSTVWGPMHWGHARSKDLLNWEHRPVALYPDSLGYIFSGSAVMDKNNTAGFGQDAMIAMFTYHDPIKEKAGANDYQTQGIAYSTNEGETWTKYEGNPVIKNPGIRDFRDPKVFWNEDLSKWQMVLVAKDHVQIYESENLKNWTKISAFRYADHPPLGVWECPDLFKLKVAGTDEEKWILIISHGGESAPNGGSGTRYFVGGYDGTTFTTEQEEGQWIDYGTDNYAGVTYNNTPNKKRLFIGWMSNWNYAVVTPTETWRSAMTLPRELLLIKKDNTYLVKSKPIVDFESLLVDIPESEISGSVPTNFRYDRLQQSVISFDTELQGAMAFELSNTIGENYKMEYNSDNGVFSIDRSASGHVDFSEAFRKSSHQKMNIGQRTNLSITIILDASSVEIFIDDGAYVMTTQVFPNENYTHFKTYLNQDTTIKNFKIKKVKEIW
ncbi:glycoside hydrolase family 32 protein [Aestuariivivens sediminis]|uniref:glycoside hydrolase family 32 protein n=1 Tax=Aestuariivivens sediminis TaxID=2913557 RepID=UPI001F56C23F|nr:glycoside hydrolase family 32 protein [Aestuariivivens sediminis]